MKIINTTDWSDTFLRRMLSWCCRQIDLPVRYVSSVRFAKSRSAWGGRAYLIQRRIGVRIGRASAFPTHARLPGVGGREPIADRIEALIKVTAHELAHLEQFGRNTRTRRGGHGGSEHLTQQTAFVVLRTFREHREALLADWNRDDRPAIVCVMVSLQEQRASKAQADLDRWRRKLKLAQTKIRKLKARVRYYDRKATAACNSKGQS